MDQPGYSVNGPIQLVDKVLGKLGRLILRVGPVGRGRAVGPLSFWFVWQWITSHYYRPRKVREGGFLKYCLKRHRGPTFQLGDGTMVANGDLVAELHLDNRTLSRTLTASDDGVHGWTFLALRTVTEDLRVLATGTLPQDVRALRGLLLLAPGARRLGFEVRPPHRTRWRTLTGFFMLGLLEIYNPTGRKRISSAMHAYYPTEIWLGRKMLEQRYGNEGNVEELAK